MKRLLAVLVFVSLFFQVVTPVIFAQTPPATSVDTTIPGRLNDDVPHNYGTHTQMVLIEVMAAISCQLTGVDPINPNGKCLGVDPQTNKIGFVENGGGAIAVVGQMMVSTFNSPVRSSDYVQYATSNFGITKGAYAQEGLGVKALNPLLSTWVAFRNVIYVLFVVIFMLIGAGIMFRFKIDPRTVMTVQNSIPKAIVVLILVTFSYAIAGFLVDLMYIFMFLFYGIIASIPGLHINHLNPTNLQGSTPFGALGGFGGFSIAKDASVGTGHIIASILDGSMVEKFLTIVLVGAGFGLSATGVGAIAGIPLILGGLTGGIAGGGAVAGFIGGIIAFFIFAAALLYAMLRLWFTLLKAYIFIMIDTVVAPIWIAGSLIPGSPLTAGAWFKHIFSYIAVFPVTLFMFLLGSVFVQQFSGGGSDYFTPPFIGGSINPKYFGAIIGLAVLLMTTEVVNIVKDALKAPSVKYQAAIGAGLGVGTSAASAIPKRIAGSKYVKETAGAYYSASGKGRVDSALKAVRLGKVANWLNANNQRRLAYRHQQHYGVAQNQNATRPNPPQGGTGGGTPPPAGGGTP